MKKMYKAEPLFETKLSASVDSIQTTIPVDDINKFSDITDENPYNLATLIDNLNDELETIEYTGKDEVNGELTGVTRAVEGSARSWNAGATIGRYHTAIEQNNMIANILDYGEVSNFTAENQNQGTNIYLSWVLPTSNDFQNIELYVSTSDIRNVDRDYCNTNATLLAGANEIEYNYSSTVGTTYYFKIFTVYDDVGVTEYSNGVSLSITAQDDTPPATVTNLAIGVEENQTASVTFTPPTDGDYSGTRLVYKTVSYPTGISDGTIIEPYSSGQEITGLTNDTTYYFRLFPYDVNGNYNTTTTGQQITVTPIYNPPADVTNLSTDVSDSTVTLSWIDPSDNDWAGTMVRRKTTAWQSGDDETTGTLVVDSTILNQYSSTGYSDTGLTNDVEYFYKLFPYDSYGAYNSTIGNNEISATPTLAKEYGLEWNQTTDSYTRLADASGLSVPDAGTDGVKTSDFDNLFPWNEMGRYNVADDGTINARYDDAGYTEDGSNGQVMVKIPKFYYKTELDTTSDKLFKWWISDVNLVGYEIHPAFVRNGVEKDAIWLGAFEAYNNGGTLESRSGVSPTANQTISTFRTQAESRGTGWSQQDLLTTSAVQLLYLIEYANFDSQGQIGNGNVGTSSSSTTGQTDSFQSEGTVSNQTSPVSYRGIENFWGSTWQFVDGFIIKDDGYYYEDDITNFNDSGTGYTHISQSLGSYGDGYQDDLEYLTGLEFGFLGNSTGGTDSTYISDYLYEHDTGEINIARLGGGWGDGLRAGGFSWYLINVSSYSFSYLSARFLKI